MTKTDIIARTIELIYISHGVTAEDLEGTLVDAMKAEELVADGLSESSLSTLLDFGLSRHNVHDAENIWDDATFLLNLVKRL